MKIISTTLRISNMTCVNCEMRIEKKLLSLKGIKSAKVSYSAGTAAITYDESIIGMTSIIKSIEKMDYRAVNIDSSVPQKTDYVKILSVIIIIFALYTIISRVGYAPIFNSFPQAKAGMNYGMLFIIGLLTSLHCVAMCGGINLSQCANAKSALKSENRFSTLRPSLLYNAGRVISYTVVGAAVGAIGSAVSFSSTAKGVVQLAAGLFMIIMRLNMLNIFPGIKKLMPRMPRIFASKIEGQKQSKRPFYIGLLNGLMPCGPLQAMQLYALSTGNAAQGALSMLIFSLGTTPLMFGLGALSTLLSKKFTKKIMTASAVMVMILGLFMFNYGINLSGININLPKIGNVVSANTNNTSVAEIKDGVQYVTTDLSSGSYRPITVQTGIPVKWNIKAEKEDINGCNNSILISSFKRSVNLQPGDNIVEFTPQEGGTYRYSCWMGMISSTITVVGDISNVEAINIDKTGQKVGYKIPVENIAVAEITSGEQIIRTEINNKDFYPSVYVVQKDIDTTWVINGAEDINLTLKFPLYNSIIDFKKGETLISFLPNEDFEFSDLDNNIFGYVKIVDDITTIDLDEIKNEISNFQPVIKEVNTRPSGVPSCH